MGFQPPRCILVNNPCFRRFINLLVRLVERRGCRIHLLSGNEFLHFFNRVFKRLFFGDVLFVAFFALAQCLFRG